MHYRPHMVFSMIFSVVLSLFGCDPAQSKNVPLDFSRDNFDEIVHYTLNNYIDPGSINVSRAYIGASEASLETLPTPLFLYPRKFVQEREKYLPPERLIPGSIVEIRPDLPYVIFQPDYVKWEKMNEKLDEERKEKQKSMTEARLREEGEKIRTSLKDEKKRLEKDWDQIPFSRKDFESVIAWIEVNLNKYSVLPETHKGEDPYKDEPFGMNQVFFSAGNGFLQTVDPHSGILDVRTWDKIRRESEDSSFEGIGALLRGGGYQDVIVETPLANSPALKSGLRAGDIIRKVDTESIEGLPLSDVVKKIRGPKDTNVTLEVNRPPMMTVHEIVIQRSVITQKAVSSEYLPEDKVGVIKVSSFLYKGDETSTLLRNEYEDLLKKSNGKMEGLVLDLRNNPGGFLEEAVNVAGIFLKKGSVVVQTRGRGTGLRPRASQDTPVIPDIPMIVLINSNSASASEIVASALLDHNRALILGERSFGKATVQEMQTRGDIIVKLTTARYYAPRGYTIQVYGVNPDVQISDEIDGSFPDRYREEDMWKHLPELEARVTDPQREKMVQRIEEAVGTRPQEAEKFIEKHKSDARRTDYMLVRSMPYLKELIRRGGL